MRHPVAASRTLLRCRKSGIPSASTPSLPSPSRNSRQARPTSSCCCRSKSNRQIVCSSSLYRCQFCSIENSESESRRTSAIPPSLGCAPSHARLPSLDVNPRPAHQSPSSGERDLETSHPSTHLVVSIERSEPNFQLFISREH